MSGRSVGASVPKHAHLPLWELEIQGQPFAILQWFATQLQYAKPQPRCPAWQPWSCTSRTSHTTTVPTGSPRSKTVNETGTLSHLAFSTLMGTQKDSKLQHCHGRLSFKFGRVGFFYVPKMDQAPIEQSHTHTHTVVVCNPLS